MAQYGFQRRLEMRKVFDLFENFRTAIAIRDSRALDYPVNIPSEAIVIDGNGVNTKSEKILTFWNYLELLRNTEIKRIAEGHPTMLRKGTDIGKMMEEEHGMFVATMIRFGQEFDWVAVSYRAKEVLKRLKSSYPDILLVR